MVYQVSGIYPLQRGRQTHCQVTMRCMSANLILLIIQYFGLNVKSIFAVWSFPRGRFFLPKLKHWDSKTDYSLDRKVALKIAKKEWDFVTPQKLPTPGTYPDFLAYIAEKIEMSLYAAAVKNRSGFIVEAIRENYQDPAVQKARELRAEKAKQKELEDLTAEFRAKRDNVLRQVVHTQPELV